MHHINHLTSCIKSYTLSSSNRVKLSHPYNTRASHKKRMEGLDQENEELREEIATLRDTVQRLNGMVEAMVASQNQPAQEDLQRTVISEVVSTPVCGVPAVDPRYVMPPNRPWGMPLNFVPEGYVPPVTENPRIVIEEQLPEGYRPLDAEVARTTALSEGYRPQIIKAPRVSAVSTVPHPIVHTVQQEEQTSNIAPAESAKVYERLDGF